MRNLLTLLAIPALAVQLNAQSYTLLSPPELPLPGVKKIALLNFSVNHNRRGDYGYEYTRMYSDKGQLAADKLTQHLMDDNRIGVTSAKGLWSQLRAANARPTLQTDAHSAIFSIAERGQLERVLAEQRLSNSGVVDDSQAAQLGKVLGIDAMLSGSVSFNVSSGSKMVGNGVYHQTRTLKSTFTVKVISVNTAEVLGVKTFEDTQEASAGPGQTLTDEGVMAGNAINNLASKAASWISPFFSTHELPVEKIKVKEFSDKAKIAREICEDKGDLKEAFAIYKEMYTTDPYCAEAVYNMGTIAGGHGNYTEALDYFKKAAELDEKAYGKFVKWAEEKVTELPLLASLGVEPKPVDLGNAVATATVPKARTRGAKADRYKVYTMASATSEIAAQVPGSTEFEIIENKGEWILIKLLGGKEGYIAKDDVKL